MVIRLITKKWVKFKGHFGKAYPLPGTTNGLDGANYIDGGNLNAIDWGDIKVINFLADDLLNKIPEDIKNGGGISGIGNKVYLTQFPVVENKFRILLMRDPSYCLSLNPSNNRVILEKISSSDPNQCWIKVDYQVYFILLNGANNMIIHAGGNGDPLTLVNWDNKPDDHNSFNLGGDEGNDYHAVRPQWDTGQNWDAWGGNAAAGVEIHTGGWHGTDNQKFKFVAYTNEDLSFQIRPVGNINFSLAHEGDDILRLRPKDHRGTTKWKILKQSNGQALIQNVLSGKFLTAGGNTDPIRLLAGNPSDRNQWSPGGDEGGKFYSLRPMWDNGQNMDAWGGNFFDGCEVHTGGWHGTNNQKWGFFAMNENITSFYPA